MTNLIQRVVVGALCAAVVSLSFPLLGPSAMAAEGDDQIFTFLQADQLEYRYSDDDRDGEGSLNWEVQGWIGTDRNKVWLKTEGEQRIGGGLEEAEVQLLYGRLIGDFFDVQLGIRYDIEPQPELAYGVLGLQGLAPNFFELDAAMFVSEKGDVSMRFEAEYEILLTQRLVLQPSIKTNVAVQSVEDRGIGSGFNDVELGLRLRYEIWRKFAPYIGINWSRKLGETEDLARENGEDVDEFTYVAGIRLWF